jgi:phage baseplate assembly protein W
MGLISINSLPKSLYNKKPYLYSDIHLDLVTKYNLNNELYQNSQVNDVKLDYDLDAIRNSLTNLFTTTPGDKILNPEFGLDLRIYLFSPASVEVASYIRDDIYQKIRLFEPRVQISNLFIDVYEDINEYDINLIISIPNLDTFNFPLLGRLNNNGFTFRN